MIGFRAFPSMRRFPCCSAWEPKTGRCADIWRPAEISDRSSAAAALGYQRMNLLPRCHQGGGSIYFIPGHGLIDLTRAFSGRRNHGNEPSEALPDSFGLATIVFELSQWKGRSGVDSFPGVYFAAAISNPGMPRWTLTPRRPTPCFSGPSVKSLLCSRSGLQNQEAGSNEAWRAAHASRY